MHALPPSFADSAELVRNLCAKIDRRQSVKSQQPMGWKISAVGGRWTRPLGHELFFAKLQWLEVIQGVESRRSVPLDDVFRQQIHQVDNGRGQWRAWNYGSLPYIWPFTVSKRPIITAGSTK